MTAPGPRARLIASAITLVRERGIEATGLTELTEHSGTARRSLYQHFPAGKLELLETSTRAAGRWMGRTMQRIDATSPRELIETIIKETSANLAANGYSQGCPIAAAALAPPEATGVRAAAADAFEAWTEQLAGVLVDAGLDEKAARTLAGFAFSSIEGALMRSVAARSTEPLDQTAAMLAPLFPR